MKSLNKKKILWKNTYKMNKYEIGYVFYVELYIVITLWSFFVEYSVWNRKMDTLFLGGYRWNIIKKPSSNLEGFKTIN